MKKARLAKILEIIQENEVETQETLLQYLKDYGMNVTQATVSRDISELRLVKSLSETGKYRYVAPKNDETKQSKFSSIFTSSVISVDYALNTVVLRCEAGMANAACAAFDVMNYSEVVGSLAGDDTMFILMRDENSAAQLCKSLNRLLMK